MTIRLMTKPKHMDVYNCCTSITIRYLTRIFTKRQNKPNGFLTAEICPKSKRQPKPLINWDQDEGIIFPALNKVAGKEIREIDYMHWWTVLGLFNEIGEGLYSNVINIRYKLAHNKKLSKGEQDFLPEQQRTY